MGEGMRLLDGDMDLGPRQGIDLEPMRVINTPEATHIRYKIVGRAPLGLDYRVAADAARFAEAMKS